MAGAVFSTGNLTREVGKPVEPYSLVKIVDGKIEHAGASDKPFGSVSEGGAPKKAQPDNKLGYPSVVRVHTSQCVVKLRTDATDFKDGDTVYAAADGKVAKSGSVAVGIVDAPVLNGKVRVNLFHPSVF